MYFDHTIPFNEKYFFFSKKGSEAQTIKNENFQNYLIEKGQVWVKFNFIPFFSQNNWLSKQLFNGSLFWSNVSIKFNLYRIKRNFFLLGRIEILEMLVKVVFDFSKDLKNTHCYRKNVISINETNKATSWQVFEGFSCVFWSYLIPEH